jgi:ATP-dependent helicase Lhr and Lhr-like helicase
MAMSLPPSNFEISPFDRLHPTVQRWVHDQGWHELRPIQASAIREVFAHNDDVILAAATAAGKTEAAFLPVLSKVANVETDCFAVLYISPLKALINDQFRRLEELCERLDLPVVKWHGDAATAAKAKALRKPRGIVLITPESIESLLVRRGGEVRRLIHGTQFIVIDELHAFMSGERGVHLASLLKRLDAQAGRRLRKIGLSATIGDFAEAKAFLNPANPASVQKVEPNSGHAELRLQIRGYREFPSKVPDDSAESLQQRASADEITEHLFNNLRGTNNLVFAGRRKDIENYSDALSRLSEAEGVPSEFFPHHGSLAKGLREELEDRLKANVLPTTAVATTTLELGIDIGSVSSVAQIGAPASIAGLRQRMGRSGRREGQASTLRIYVTEPDKPDSDDLFARLRPDIVQAVAAVQLLQQKWVEPGGTPGLQLSTLLHQTLALIRERGGITARDLFALLAGPGPFAGVTQAHYVALLRAMASSQPKLIGQSPDGVLMLGPLGEQLTDKYDFYAVFMSDEEYRIVSEHRALGSVPIFNPLKTGDYMIFAGRRWIVESIDDKAKVVRVAAAPAGKVPDFQSKEGAPLHDRLVAEMRTVYRSSERPVYLDAAGWGLLQEGRETYSHLELDARRTIQDGDNAFLFLWRGTVASETFRLALAHAGISCRRETIGLRAECDAKALESAIEKLRTDPPTAASLAIQVQNLRRQKYDSFLPDDLLREAFSRSRLDMTALLAMLAESRQASVVHFAN